MKILVGCEESQAITIELRKLGHEAFSCDLQECSGGHPEWHIVGDIMEIISTPVSFRKQSGSMAFANKWDMMILHPPCTAIAVSGNSTYAKGKPKHDERIKSVKWTQKLWDYAISKCDKVCLENPVGVLNTMGNFPKPQYIQPWQFGHKISKKTGLWLYGLPKLIPTKIVEPEWIYYNGISGNRCSPDHYKNAFSKDRGKERSKTYSGIAKAIAIQFTN